MYILNIIMEKEEDNIVIEEIITEKDKENIVELTKNIISQNIPYKKIPEYYLDEDKYISENVKWYIEKAKKKLYLLDVKNAKGYGHYRGAVVCSYMKSEILKMDYFENKRDFEDCTITEIGIANENYELGIVLEDYFNG